MISSGSYRTYRMINHLRSYSYRIIHTFSVKNGAQRLFSEGVVNL